MNINNYFIFITFFLSIISSFSGHVKDKRKGTEVREIYKSFNIFHF
jgi:hypothetical protein